MIGYSQDPVVARLESARTDLLDLGLRNPLLNYRLLRSRGLEIVDELPEEVFRLLVLERKPMSFLPAADETQLNLLDQPESDAETAKPTARHVDTRLQTALPPPQLQSRLLATYYAARTFMEEQGANVLYLALGMLRWFEEESSQGGRRAPLLLIPVELVRSSAAERFQLRYTEDEIGHNLSLGAKMEAEFRLSLPPLPPVEELKVTPYLEAVAQVVRDQDRWSVDTSAIALGLFSFGKFLMYRDLDSSMWSEGDGPAQHPVIRSLLQEGFSEPSPSLTEDDQLDRHVAPTDIHQVVDADSSQTLALLAVNEGRNLVIQGPPGTGKSQTITNIIAEAIGRGKTVLFVAEKMAALEVVKRRLDSAGLGEACLELHSHKTNKKALLSQLQRTTQLGKPRQADLEAELAMLGQLRDRLNGYAEAVNTSIGESGVRPYEAFGALARLQQRMPTAPQVPRFHLETLPHWTAIQYKRGLRLVEELQERLAGLGPPRDHPFYGTQRLVFLPTERGRLGATIEAARQATVQLAQRAAHLTGLLGYPPPVGRADTEVRCQWIRHALTAPDMRGIQLGTADWRARRDDLVQLLAAGRSLEDLHRRYDAVLAPEAWEQDLLEVRQHLAAYGTKWWRVLSGSYRRARNRVMTLCREAPPTDSMEQLALVDAVLEVRRAREIIRKYDSLARALFGAKWRGEASAWLVLSHLFEWISWLHTATGVERLDEALVDLFQRVPYVDGMEAAVATVEKALVPQASAISDVVTALELDENVRFGPGEKLVRRPFTEQETCLRTWYQQLDDLQGMVAFNIVAQACHKEGLGAIVKAASAWPQAGSDLVPAFKYSWFEGLLERAYRERPVLAQFDGDSHDYAIRTFRKLDTLTFEYNRVRLAAKHWEGLPTNDGAGQYAVLRREFEKRSRHLPVRQLMSRAGNVIQAIKPVFMMGPQSIATFLAPGSMTFDLVIFDEASQVTPVDAFGSILRGKQIVVVGDSRQLPPTSFFDALVAEDEANEDDVTSDIESILGLFASQGATERMLRWHYRSRHESLITVSNHLFYSNRLIVFPSPDAERREAGLTYRHLPHTSYDRGRSKTNVQEAEAVARAVMEHAVRQPHLTLGVAAFSVAQMQAVQDQLEVLRRQDPSCEPFFAAHPHEPFFVKNLETIQGDERDVIFISVGYGRTAEGYVAMNFGPLNGKHGERRLNVLITRARIRCEVFTNMTADDIDLQRTNASGVRALKIFLSYAQTGRLDVPEATGRDFDSPFEEAVADALTAAGHQIDPQVRSAGFLIDLAVVDPQRPGRYLLGIECDGATYHSARSARDRDRLRQQVLEGLGWRIHRIWSTDWFRNPERELKRLVTAIEEARAYTPSDDVVASTVPQVPAYGATIVRDATEETKVSTVSSPRYELARLAPFGSGQDLHQVPTAMLASRVVEVVSIEGPVHISEVMRRIADAAGVRRVGNRIQAAIEEACAQAVRSGRVQRRGKFLWLKDMQQPVLRDRSVLPSASRRIELVAPEEIALAVEQVVANAYGISVEDIPPLACRMLGFQRATDEMRSQVLQVIRALTATGRLLQQGDQVVTGT